VKPGAIRFSSPLLDKASGSIDAVFVPAPFNQAPGFLVQCDFLRPAEPFSFVGSFPGRIDTDACSIDHYIAVGIEVVQGAPEAFRKILNADILIQDRRIPS
jgi:hypothetical protein